MPILSLSAGRVAAIKGRAYFLDDSGGMRPVQVGDELVSGQRILTDQQGIVEIAPEQWSPRLAKLIAALAAAPAPSSVDQTVTALEANEPQALPAAGFLGGGSGSLLPGLRVERVEEAVQGDRAPSGLVGPNAAQADLLDAHAASALGSPWPLKQAEGPGTPEVPEDPLVLVPEEPIIRLPNDGITWISQGEVSEAGLTLPGAVGSAGTFHAVTVSGQLDMTDLAQRGVVPAGLVVPTFPAVQTSALETVQWLADGQGGLVGQVMREDGPHDILLVSWQAQTGQWQATLLEPLNHAGLQDGVLHLRIGVESQGLGPLDAVQLDLAVQDAMPAAHPSVQEVLMVLDTSGLNVPALQGHAAPVQGQLLAGQDMGADGFGGVLGVTVNGVEHLADPTLPWMTVDTALGGKLTVNVLSGEYELTGGSGASQYGSEIITFNLSDRDGDAVSSSMRLTVNPVQVKQDTMGADHFDGHEGSDVFVWHPRAGSPVTDTVAHFRLGAPAQEGADVLDLRDLLHGEHGASGSDALSAFLRVDATEQGSTLHISSYGRFQPGQATGSTQDAAIQLTGVDLRHDLGLASDASSSQILAKLIAQGQLLVDG